MATSVLCTYSVIVFVMSLAMMATLTMCNCDAFAKMVTFTLCTYNVLVFVMSLVMMAALALCACDKCQCLCQFSSVFLQFDSLYDEFGYDGHFSTVYLQFNSLRSIIMIYEENSLI